MKPTTRELTAFEWDETKRATNLAKHGIDFLRAVELLLRPHAEKPSDRNGEVRILAVCPDTDRLIAVVYTMRGDVCRIISARAARKNEQEQYRKLFS